jgi:integrase
VVVSSSSAAYVAGIVHRWDLRRPGLPGSQLFLEVPDGRRESLNLPRSRPAGVHRFGAARARGVSGGYRGLTREAYTLDLRQFTGWCRRRSLPLFSVRRADIETFARELEARGRARATVTRRLSMIAGFYRYAVEEELLDHSPAAHVRRPRVDYESHATALDRNEVGALLVAAGLGPAAEHALFSLLALNGLRVSEATGADIEHLGLERGHRTLVITRKGGKVVTIPLAPRTARAIDLAIGERASGRCSSPPTAGASTGTAPPG